jgi:hypothetical protein
MSPFGVSRLTPHFNSHSTHPHVLVWEARPILYNIHVPIDFPDTDRIHGHCILPERRVPACSCPVHNHHGPIRPNNDVLRLEVVVCKHRLVCLENPRENTGIVCRFVKDLVATIADITLDEATD